MIRGSVHIVDSSFRYTVGRGRHHVVNAASVATELAATILGGLAFWASVVLPFLAVGVLVGGLHSSEPVLIVTLFIINAVALVAGHGYAHDPTA